MLNTANSEINTITILCFICPKMRSQTDSVIFNRNMHYLNKHFEQLGLLPTPFSFIWVLQMLIGYLTLLINIYLGVLISFAFY